VNASERDKLPVMGESPLWEAALEAERQTGRREPTIGDARAHLVVRVGRICGGAVVLLAGIVLMILPGPGLVLIIAGLTILAVDVPFARRLRDIAVQRADRATNFIPRKLKLALVVGGTVVGLGISVLLLLR
jgi:hypothetical protein